MLVSNQKTTKRSNARLVHASVMWVFVMGMFSTPWTAMSSAAEPLEVVKKAIDAYGGKDNLTKYHARTITGKGTMMTGREN